MSVNYIYPILVLKKFSFALFYVNCKKDDNESLISLSSICCRKQYSVRLSLRLGLRLGLRLLLLLLLLLVLLLLRGEAERGDRRTNTSGVWLLVSSICRRTFSTTTGA